MAAATFIVTTYLYSCSIFVQSYRHAKGSEDPSIMTGSGQNFTQIPTNSSHSVKQEHSEGMTRAEADEDDDLAMRANGYFSPKKKNEKDIGHTKEFTVDNIYSLSFPCKNTEFVQKEKVFIVIVVNCGSTGTRFTGFVFPSLKESNGHPLDFRAVTKSSGFPYPPVHHIPSAHKFWDMSIKKLRDIGDFEEDLRAHVESIVLEYKDWEIKKVEIISRTTAGIRRLYGDTIETARQQMGKAVANVSAIYEKRPRRPGYFKRLQKALRKSAVTPTIMDLTGKEEGYFAWIATAFHLNYLKNSVDGELKDNILSIDHGGQSMQLAMLAIPSGIPEKSALINLTNFFPGIMNKHVYSMSVDGFGSNAFLEIYLHKKCPTGDTCTLHCIPAGMKISATEKFFEISGELEGVSTTKRTKKVYELCANEASELEELLCKGLFKYDGGKPILWKGKIIGNYNQAECDKDIAEAIPHLSSVPGNAILAWDKMTLPQLQSLVKDIELISLSGGIGYFFRSVVLGLAADNSTKSIDKSDEALTMPLGNFFSLCDAVCSKLALNSAFQKAFFRLDRKTIEANSDLAIYAGCLNVSLLKHLLGKDMCNSSRIRIPEKSGMVDISWESGMAMTHAAEWMKSQCLND